MNLQTIRENILSLLNDSLESAVFFTEAQINDTINEALEVIAEEVTDIRKQIVTTTKAGKAFYTTYELSSDMMTPIRIWADPRKEPLEVITMQQLAEARERFLQVKSDSPTWWYPLSFDAFGLWPSPTQGGGILRIDYLAWPAELARDTDSPEFKETEQDLAVIYGVFDGLMRQWEVERAIDQFQQFSGLTRDQAFKNETRRIHRMFSNRRFDSDAFPRL